VKTVPAALQAHLNTRACTIARCWQVKRTDNAVFGFTDHDVDIILDISDGEGSVIYEAASGMTGSAVTASDKLAVENFECVGLFESARVTASDLEGGLWDYAAVKSFLVNHQSLSDGIIKLPGRGNLGEVRLKDNTYVAEFRGLTDHLNQRLGDLYSPLCRAEFTDSECGLDPATYTVSSTVTAVADRRNFIDSARTEADGYYKYGLVTWTSGNNSGLSMEVKNYTLSTTAIELVQALPFAIQVGDAYDIIAGCDKTFTTCAATFSNALSFRGEPHVPGEQVAAWGSPSR
jgi:uncharacterized phage protein (TIGR02218 family)